MKAILFDKRHSPDKLRLATLEKPVPKIGEVLVEVVAASINAADYRSKKMGTIPKQKIFGSAVAGTVVAVGEKVERFTPGDAVLGDLADFGFGGLAEFVSAPEKAFAHMPSGALFAEMATLPVAATTALAAVRNKGKIKKGQRVLIVGSGGGVGAFAVQLAKHFGGQVTAVCSTQNVDQAAFMGANQVIDYTQEDFTQSTARFDLIIAVNGNYPLLSYQRLLAKNGVCVTVGGALAQIFKSMIFGWALSLGGKKFKTLAVKPNPDDLQFLAHLLAAGQLKTVIENRFTLEKTPEAMAHLSAGHARGKVVIDVGANR